MGKNSRVELLAPAGSAESFYGAVHAGADAVYLGGSRFGARAYAENFTTGELTECIRYGHLLGKKIYLTVNTLLKEDELAELFEYLKPFYESGLDAVIVQDMGVLRFIREYFPGLKLHASTQMTLCSRYGAKLLQSLGASRIVPARELSLAELAAIKSESGVELEVFIHGAMCYCYSGQCLFSSILGGRSGNRGRCAQPCRLPYRVAAGTRESGVCYPLSLKDMCTVEHIPQLIESGLDSFKIEGRMKKPEYAAGVTAIYRKYMDQYYELQARYGAEEAAERFQAAKEDVQALSSLYIRSEKQDGYYFRHNGRDMVTLGSPAYSGNDQKLLRRIRETYLTDVLRLPVTAYAEFKIGYPAKLTLQAEKAAAGSSGGLTGISATVDGGSVERAQKQPVTEENIRKQLSKTGDSAFRMEQLSICMDENIFYPLKQINELRRQAVSALEEQLLQKRGCVGTEPETAGGEYACGPHRFSTPKPSAGNSVKVAVSVRTLPQLRAVVSRAVSDKSLCPERIYLDGDLLFDERDRALELCGSLREQCVFYAALPYVIRRADETYLEQLAEIVGTNPLFKGFLIRSLDGLQFAGEKGLSSSSRLDANVYIWNSGAAESFSSLVEGFCLPVELNAGEQRQLTDRTKRIWEKLVYGRIPMMITANCLLKTTDHCKKNAVPKTGLRERKPEEVRLIDRYRKDFPVIYNCRHCLNVIYNSVPLSLHGELELWKKRADLRMDFTIETEDEAGRIFDGFLKGLPLPYREYTAGHEKRGVE